MSGAEDTLLLGRSPVPAPTGEARTRLRRARPLVTVAQLLGPTALVVLVWVDFANRRDWNPVVIPTVLFLICLWRWRRGRYRPHGWPRTALWMTVASGLLIDAVLVTGLLGEPTFDSGVSTVTFPFLVLGGTLAILWSAWTLAPVARRLVLEPFTIDLVDSPLELVFPLRDEKVLQIRHDEVLVDGASLALLDEIGPVAHVDGPGIRFDALGEDVTLFTDRGAEIAEVIQRRRPVPAPPQPPRRILSDQERSTVDGQQLMRRRREADVRVANAVRVLRAAPSAEQPAARAALRDLCDETIAELIHGSDLLAPRGRLMMRRDAARIQRLRDHYCGR